MSDAARLLDDTTDKLLSRLLPETATARGTGKVRADLCRALIDSGLNLALASESAGGLSADLADASAITWRWGYHAAPLPVAGLLLGPLAATLVGIEAQDVTLLCEPDETPVLPTPASAIALTSGGSLSVLDADAGEPFRDLAGEPWRRVGLEAGEGRPINPTLAADLRTRAALLIASQMTGAMARVIEMIIEHANTRQQFGRPLGKFQAVQNLIAEAASEQVSTQAAVDAAIRAFDAGAPEALLTNSAKAQAGRAATIASAAAHQVLAAIGFTEEHVLGHFSRRLWTWRDQWGRQSAAEEAIGCAAVDDARGLWRHIVD